MSAFSVISFEWSISEFRHLQTGEIDIIEGVHDNEHNQVTWHTNDGMILEMELQ